MSEDKFLHIYLNDHLAGAVAGVELARRAASSNEGSDYGDFLQALADEIEHDRTALEETMDAVGAPKSAVKQGAAWVAEKVGRLKLNGQLTGYSDLSRLVEFEGLAVGVEAKLSLWRSLRQVAATDDRLDEMKLDDLVTRAESQRDRLENFRLRAAEEALSR
jgi:predicted DNA-binding ribbon-helix-helix protein